MLQHVRLNRLKPHFSTTRARDRRRPILHSSQLGLEVLESRELLATFTVTNVHNSGTGSLRQAIVAANSRPGSDTIDFNVAGTIRVGPTSLPAITDTVFIDGTSAPSFAGSPVVTVNFQGSRGLNFARGADGSILSSLSLVKAGNAGVTLSASNVTIQGNYIGLQADGTTVAGNRGDGVRINASSHGDLIGQSDPVSSIRYYNADSVSMQPVNAWQGIRNADTTGEYLIAGTSGDNGLLYEGPIAGARGTSYSVNFPNATATSVYGPDNLDGTSVRLVGSYENGDGRVHGFLFQGTTADLSQSGNYRTIDYPNAHFTYVHSTMGGLAVGNADGSESILPDVTGHAFLYDVAQSTFLQDIVYPDSTSTSAYGIWYNGGTSYTICGGYSRIVGPSNTIGRGYLVDYDSVTGLFTHWTSFDYPNGVIGQDYVTHFEGISSDEKGVYTLSADSAQTGSPNQLQGSLVTVRRNPDGTFGNALWVDLNDPTVPGLVSANSVAGNQLVGVISGKSGTSAYQATVNTAFQLSNVISGNRGNGIGIYGADDNQIAMNDIGTDASGTSGRGNAKNGIFITNRATGNLIGGQATGGNDPTAGVIIRPPQGNLISGNRGNGVFINNGATQTLLSGNFVGTTASGNLALGNRLDGVAIVNANGNQLIGCTYQQSPFVFYNVLSGNGGNGLRVTNSNNTTVQADFMGIGANNARIVANGGDGLLVSGSSTNTQVGGVIPLGNVIAGNNKNGIEVSGRASGFTSFNTFGGIFAFGGAAPNRRDGILVTSNGGNNLIRTSIVSGNLRNGIELGGNATGVQVTDTAVGTDTDIRSEIPNGGDGIKIDGHAHNNAIGGFQPSIEPEVTVSGNDRYGIEIGGSARKNVIFHTYIGTNFLGVGDLGNALGGIYIGSPEASATIGGAASPLQNIIRGNGGPGVIIRSSSGNTVLGNDIGGNARNGVTIIKARRLTIGGGGSGAGNRIVGNQGYGLTASGVCTGSSVQANVIAANTQGNVNLTNSRGITYVP